jgi:hypothetical protein
VFQVTITAETSARGGLGALAVQGLKADAALVAVEDGVFERVDALVLVELTVDAATLGRMRELAQDELGLHEPAVVLQRGRETAVRASPRGLPDSRLWHVGAAQDSPAGGRLRHSVKPNLIHQQWDELLRLAASLRDGTVTASLLVARLHAQQRRSVTARPRQGWVVLACLGYSRVGAGVLVFSKETEDLLAGIAGYLSRLGALPKELVWDRQAGVHGHGGRPSEAFAAFCGQLKVSWRFCEPADPQAKRRRRAAARLRRDELRARPPVRQRPGFPRPAGRLVCARMAAGERGRGAATITTRWWTTLTDGCCGRAPSRRRGR